MHAGKKLIYPQEVEEILQNIIQSDSKNEFEELIFQAKFLVRTKELIYRIGPKSEGYQKLQAEFQSGMKKAVSVLKKIIAGYNGQSADRFSEKFLVTDINGMNRLLELFEDFSCIKNWQIDGKPLPYDTGR